MVNCSHKAARQLVSFMSSTHSYWLFDWISMGLDDSELSGQKSRKID